VVLLFLVVLRWHWLVSKKEGHKEFNVPGSKGKENSHSTPPQVQQQTAKEIQCKSTTHNKQQKSVSNKVVTGPVPTKR
jgi:hypothetical protein